MQDKSTENYKILLKEIIVDINEKAIISCIKKHFTIDKMIILSKLDNKFNAVLTQTNNHFCRNWEVELKIHQLQTNQYQY